MKDIKEMFQVLKALDNGVYISLTSGEVPKWYVCGKWEVKNRACLEGVSGFGDTPEQAVTNVYERLTERDTIVVLSAYDNRNRRQLTWKGFMWQDVS